MVRFVPRFGSVEPFPASTEKPGQDDFDSFEESVEENRQEPEFGPELKVPEDIRDMNDVDLWAPLYGFDENGERTKVPDNTSYRMGVDGRELSDDYLVGKLDEYDARVTESIIMRNARRDLVRSRYRDMVASIMGPDNRIRWNRSDVLVDSDTRRMVNTHLAETNKLSGKFALALGALAATVVFVGALLADYLILSEFWTRALMNEFLEIPPALVSSVWSKSVQVIFAALAIHFLISRMTHFGRGVFISGIGILTIFLLISIGTLSGQSTPRTDATTAEQQSSASVDETLAALGLGPADAATDAETKTAPAVMVREGWWPDLLGWFQAYAWDIWYMSIFLVVTSVGALALHSAATQAGRLFKLEDEATRRRQAHQLRQMEAEFNVHEHFLKQVDRPAVRETMMRRYLNTQINQYSEGAAGSARDNQPNLKGIYTRVFESWCALKRRTLKEMADAGEQHVRRNAREQRKSDGNGFKVIPGRREANAKEA